MRCRVWRSLDASSSLFGLKGSYLVWMVAALAAVLLAAVVVGGLTSSILGTMVFLAGGIASYFGVVMLQSRYSEKDIQGLFAALKMHRWIFVGPVRYRDIWRRR